MISSCDSQKLGRTANSLPSSSRRGPPPVSSSPRSRRSHLLTRDVDRDALAKEPRPAECPAPVLVLRVRRRPEDVPKRQTRNHGISGSDFELEPHRARLHNQQFLVYMSEDPPLTLPPVTLRHPGSSRSWRSGTSHMIATTTNSERARAGLKNASGIGGDVDHDRDLAFEVPPERSWRSRSRRREARPGHGRVCSRRSPRAGARFRRERRAMPRSGSRRSNP